MSKKKLKILLSGGGTGGHIFPAVAIADGLKEKFPNAEFLFVGAKGRMEMEKVPQSGYKIVGLWISGIQRKLDVRNFSFPFKLISSLWKASRIVRNFKPDVAIGTGGYASGPLLYIASGRRVPTLILEQNSYPGITNKLLAKKVNTICVSTPGMEKYFDKNKLVITGSPIRDRITNSKITHKEACEHFDLETNKPVMLIIGGSQGARGINIAVASNLKQLSQKGIQILWQTGVNYYDEAWRLVKEHSLEKTVFVHKFIMEMEIAYSACDFVISRAGAIALAEIVQMEKACIFIPLPTSAEDHQTKNALTLVDGNAALFLNEKDAEKNLFSLIEDVMLNENKKQELIKNIKKFKTTDATKNIVNEVIKLLN
ncbi:MAG: undecaprenyldiphospho-muramoylpentapeptide beta-N-acetylglucosaminyltransferase [Marinilabiliales bacterium]|nr:MAG: undecaprenyldiphospho-muramoylpentapeptide beta-N-acetylglucosaminyltransferase [Marinilabiliales bacterium]